MYLQAVLTIFAQVVAIVDVGVNCTIVQNCIPGVDLVNEGSAFGNGHGTNVGIIVNRHCPTCKILPVRFYLKGIPPAEKANAALAWLYRWKKRHRKSKLVVNLSWQLYEKPPGMAYQIRRLHRMGVKIVAAAGNNSADIVQKNVWPAQYRYVIPVGALDVSGDRAAYSNTGARVKVFTRGSYDFPTIWKEGTSYAAPVVAAILAATPD